VGKGSPSSNPIHSQVIQKINYSEWRQSLQDSSSRQPSQCPIHSGLDMARRALHLHLHEPWGSRLSRGHLAQKLHRGLTTDHPTTLHQHCLRLCSSPGSQHPVLVYNQTRISLLRYQPTRFPAGRFHILSPLRHVSMALESYNAALLPCRQLNTMPAVS
jgi:hypothetical protein